MCDDPVGRCERAVVTPPRKDRLGRGLGALLGEYSTAAAAPGGDVRSVVIGSIFPNPLQPRRDFPEAEIEELTSSIRENGLLQPLLVRPAGPGKYELVAGERRLRSIQRLGWQEVPVVVREVEDEALLVLALVANDFFCAPVLLVLLHGGTESVSGTITHNTQSSGVVVLATRLRIQ